MAGQFALLPNTRSELATVAAPPAAGGQRRRLAVNLEIQADSLAREPRIPVTGELLGPGDVAAVNRSMISRVEPQSGLPGFEPNYMPFLEFVDADFPWRYSLDSGNRSRLKPWIVLIALTPDEFEFVDGGANMLPRIRVKNPSNSLPNLAQSWAFAHVQVALATASDTVSSSMSDPVRHFSRLLCPRRLEERRAYFLFLVPAYESAKLAALGSKEAPAAFDASAWSAASTEPVDLPVYYQSRFVTDSLQDLETLLRRLRALTSEEIDAAGAAKQASAATPGYYPGYANPGATFEIQGALSQPDAVQVGLETDQALTRLMTRTLHEVIKAESDSEDVNGPDPLVAFPPYGWRYRQETSVARSRATQQRWFDLINLDLKFRHAAGLGAETVRRNQELFAKRCWEQYEEVLDTNRRLARLNTAAVLTQRVSDKHVARLSPDTLLTLAEPIQPYVKAAGGAAVVNELRQNGAPSSFASRGLRRISAKRAVTVDVPGHGPVRSVPAPAIPGDVTSNPVTRPLQRARTDRINDTLLASQGLAGPIASAVSPFLLADRFAGAVRPRRVGVRVRTFESAAWSARLTDTLTKLPRVKAELTINGLLPVERNEIMPVYRSPVIEEPLSNRLREFAADAILTDASRIPPDTVAIFEENRRFIEAFLVGANHEMNKELRWREFPTDMRGTIFRRFWDRGRPASDPAGDDTADIHTWNDRLGRHFSPGDVNKASDLVVVIHSDIVRKLDMPIVLINEAVGSAWQSGSGIDHEPVFFGKVGADIAYYGFSVTRDHILREARNRVFLLIYEPAGRLRFGLDVATTAVRQQRQDVGAQSLAFPIRMLGRTERRVKLRRDPPVPVSPSPAKWDDFSWQHVRRTAAGYVDFTSRFTVPGEPDLWGLDKTSASVARSFWQKPLMVVLPLRRIF